MNPIEVCIGHRHPFLAELRGLARPLVRVVLLILAFAAIVCLAVRVNS
jgi:hypothetical protein